MEANKEIKIIQWNANSIRQRKGFTQYLYENEVGIACIQEIQLKMQHRFEIKGHKIMRKDRSEGKKEGV